MQRAAVTQSCNDTHPSTPIITLETELGPLNHASIPPRSCICCNTHATFWSAPMRVQTDCLGQAHYVDWSNEGGWHPRTFEPEDVWTGVIGTARGQGLTCNAAAAIASAEELFEGGRTRGETRDGGPVPGEGSEGVAGPVGATALVVGQHKAVVSQRQQQEGQQLLGRETQQTPHQSQQRLAKVEQQHRELDQQAVEQPQEQEQHLSPSDWAAQGGFEPLAYKCPLFARKFAAASAPRVLAMSLSCAGGGLGYWCRKQYEHTSALQQALR